MFTLLHEQECKSAKNIKNPIFFSNCGTSKTYPVSQLQVYPMCWSLHVAPFVQLFVMQSSIPTVQFAPSYPVPEQSQSILWCWSIQTPPFSHESPRRIQSLTLLEHAAPSHLNGQKYCENSQKQTKNRLMTYPAVQVQE